MGGKVEVAVSLHLMVHGREAVISVSASVICRGVNNCGGSSRAKEVRDAVATL